MAITSTVNLNDAQATPVAHTFEVLRTLPNGIDRIKSGTTVAEPIMLAVRHSTTPGKSGSDTVDRHNVSIKSVKIDSVGKPHELTFSFTMNIPRSEEFTSANMDDIQAWIINFIAPFKADLRLGKS